ncbi:MULTISPECIES: DUF4381 domain-containing protein [Rhizobium]|uniref:DUF4381 domain-containing protein n=1 Tax=Rhizobium TaxID=379 RepID=UPI001A9165FE|nr:MULTISPECIES: DUF4381 domain-containing protein [Rhizobium]MBY3169908.1 DUF4381 domain-containing protein [Rhizobium laguerreae]MBY3447835.1 DUF4381 domain-containing protein [Rhizobium laguerreae]MBY5558381.1 DUF4381 domain-containing protein [Rhizobium leguminosarum]MBY5728032.1 DUF4381 domain-containing protein [Rhizobium leguminosarum]QSW27080.1 DUF4381 domain-containing protein [Rhizobium leguminosarum]
MEPTAKLDPAAEAALRSLHGLAMPEPVSWMPQTWGWAVLVGAMLVMLALAGLRWLLHYRADAYRREALALLVVIEERLRRPETRHEGVLELGEILKRTALAAWPRREVASLSGDGWVRFLDAYDEDGAGRALERLLDDFEYHGAEIVADLPSNVCGDLVAAARDWIERHHVPA